MFPTPVGMNRDFARALGFEINVPHTRGDEPIEFGTIIGKDLCSPHPWG